MGKHVSMREKIALAVESQLQYDTPPETREILRRLLDLGYSEPDAKELIGKAMACHYYRVMSLRESPDKSAYVRDLQQLPVLPWETDAGITEDAVIRDVLDNDNIDTRTEEEWRVRYQKLRSTTYTIHNAIIKLMGSERLFESARALGMARRDGFASLSDTEINIICDHAIYADPRKRAGHIQAYRATQHVLDDDSEMVLASMLDAKYCLLQYESHFITDVGIKVIDQLRQQTFVLFDINLSHMANQDMLIATHIIAPEGISMTTGGGLPIPDNESLRAIDDLLVVEFGSGKRNFDEHNTNGKLATGMIRILLKTGASERIRYAEPVQPTSLPQRSSSKPAHIAIGRNAPGRNAPCPCGSGKKYKQCCG